MQTGGKIGRTCRGGHADESSLTWWCYLLRVIYARLKRWWITGALPRSSFVFEVSKCSIEAVIFGQPHVERGCRCADGCTLILLHVWYLLCTLCSTCASLHVCTENGWRLTGSWGKTWYLWPEYIFPHINDEWGSPHDMWQSCFACLFKYEVIIAKVWYYTDDNDCNIEHWRWGE